MSRTEHNKEAAMTIESAAFQHHAPPSGRSSMPTAASRGRPLVAALLRSLARALMVGGVACTLTGFSALGQGALPAAPTGVPGPAGPTVTMILGGP